MSVRVGCSKSLGQACNIMTQSTNFLGREWVQRPAFHVMCCATTGWLHLNKGRLGHPSLWSSHSYFRTAHWTWCLNGFLELQQHFKAVHCFGLGRVRVLPCVHNQGPHSWAFGSQLICNTPGASSGTCTPEVLVIEQAAGNVGKGSHSGFAQLTSAKPDCCSWWSNTCARAQFWLFFWTVLLVVGITGSAGVRGSVLQMAALGPLWNQTDLIVIVPLNLHVFQFYRTPDKPQGSSGIWQCVLENCTLLLLSLALSTLFFFLAAIQSFQASLHSSSISSHQCSQFLQDESAKIAEF